MIDILLATYNGEKFLAAQIDSILAQKYVDWRLLIHDDGSSDGTVAVITAYQRVHPRKIVFIDDGIRSLGAKNNFAHLMRLATAEYVMFCDQDDIWMAGKVASTLDAMIAEESVAGKSAPIGVFSDLRLVDEGGRVLADSVWAHLRTKPELARSARTLAVRNCVIGCTLMVNRAAMTVSQPVPSEAVMHDWWIALSVLRNGGQLVPLREATVAYRQHGTNTVGAPRFSVASRALAAVNVSQWIRRQDQVFRMARRSRAITNRWSFLVSKVRVLTQSLMPHS